MDHPCIKRSGPVAPKASGWAVTERASFTAGTLRVYLPSTTLPPLAIDPAPRADLQELQTENLSRRLQCTAPLLLASAPLKGPLTWGYTWWQVLGSNQRRHPMALACQAATSSRFGQAVVSS